MKKRKKNEKEILGIKNNRDLKIGCTVLFLIICFFAAYKFRYEIFFNPIKRGEEEHLEKIELKIQKDYMCEKAGYDFTGFEAEILYAPDGKPEYFLIEFVPIGHLIGFIYKNRYFVLIGMRSPSDLSKESFYKQNGIEKDNKYYAFPDYFATMSDNKLIDLETNHIINSAEAKEMAKNSKKTIKGVFINKTMVCY